MGNIQIYISTAPSPRRNWISLPQCVREQHKWCQYIVWKFREIRSSNSRVDRAHFLANVWYDTVKN